MSLYVIASSKPSIVNSPTGVYKLVLLDNSKENYTTDVNEAAIFHSYEDAHEETTVDVSNHDFVLDMELAEKIFDYGKYKWN